MVIVDHGDFISIYAYNEKNLVKRGDSVLRGQQIALVGRRNEGEECMLYFELRNKEGVPLDPTEYIRNAQ
jgi:septal ring factor EnvC (AmiA/AmiB activator)